MGERLEVPARTTPTWEMELLVSGATVFGLLPLPGKLDALFYEQHGRALSTLVQSLMMALWIYARIAVMTLVGTFILHLALRGFWVALVGLDSVYPRGVQPERLRGGPIQ